MINRYQRPLDLLVIRIKIKAFSILYKKIVNIFESGNQAQPVEFIYNIFLKVIIYLFINSRALLFKRRHIKKKAYHLNRGKIIINDIVFIFKMEAR